MKWAENITRMGGDLKGVPSRGFLRRHAVKCWGRIPISREPYWRWRQ